MEKDSAISEILIENLHRLNRAFEALNISFRVQEDLIIPNGKTYDHREKFRELGFYWDASEKQWIILKYNLEKDPLPDFIFGSVLDQNALHQQIQKYADQIQSPFLKKLLYQIIIEGPLQESYFKQPAAIKHHHAYENGLAEHSLQVLKGALELQKVYPFLDINQDILIVGSLLHDIGKVDCYLLSSRGIYGTEILDDFDHIAWGIHLISQFSSELAHSEKEKQELKQILQIITSHHELKEWGSPRPPGSNEAWIIHTQDMLSSRIGGGFKNLN